jgi:hypothetical protein
MGRPKMENKRQYRHTFRFNAQEELVFQNKLRKLGAKKKSERIRTWVLEGVKHDC